MRCFQPIESLRTGAGNDQFDAVENTLLTGEAPGVLENDTDGNSNSQSISSEGNIFDPYKQHSNQNNLNSTQ